MTRKINTIPPKRLAETITAAATSFKLNNILGFDGVALSSSIVGDKLYCSFQDTTGTLLELMEIDPTTIASASITILKRGLQFNEDGTETEVAGNKRQWIKNQTIVNLGTDTPAMFNSYVKTADDQDINDVKTFLSSPIVPTPTTDMQASTKKYVDDKDATAAHLAGTETFTGTKSFTTANRPKLTTDADTATVEHLVTFGQLSRQAISGAPNASPTVKGIVEIATQSEYDAGTDTGATGAALVVPPSIIKAGVTAARPTTTTMIPKSSLGYDTYNATGYDNNTTLYFGLIDVTESMTLNSVTIFINSYTASGTVKIALFTQDGVTKLWEVTTATISSGGQKVKTNLSSPYALTPGKYYIAHLITGTGNFETGRQDVGASLENAINFVTGEVYYVGKKTGITASTMPTLFDPTTSVSTERFGTLLVRFEN